MNAWWRAVALAIVLLAACGRSELNLATTAGGESGGPVFSGASAGGGAAGVNGGAGVAADSIQLHDFGDHQVVQRALGGSAQSVQISGTFRGPSITRVQAQVVSFATDTNVIVPWTELGTTSGVAYSGAFEVPQGGWYRTVVRGLDPGGNEVARAFGAHRWGVGMNILCIGQSNMVGHGGFSYTTAGDLAGLFSNDRIWKQLADPYDAGGDANDVDFGGFAGSVAGQRVAGLLSWPANRRDSGGQRQLAAGLRGQRLVLGAAERGGPGRRVEPLRKFAGKGAPGRRRRADRDASRRDGRYQLDVS